MRRRRIAVPVAVQPLLPFDAEEPRPAPAAPQPPKTRFAPPSWPESRLINELGQICAEIPLDEKILVAPSLAIGHQLVERLARAGHTPVHLRVETVRNLAHAIAGPQLAREGRRLLSRAQALALVEQACAETLDRSSYFGPLRDRPGLHRALQRAFDELRGAGISPSDLPADAFADRRKARELGSIADRYAAALESGGWVDAVEVLRRAADIVGRSVDRGAWYVVPDATELSATETGFLERLAGSRLRRIAGDPPESWRANAAAARLFRAIGEENEIRSVFRAVLASRIPFDHVEILHTDSSTYPALVFELASEHAIPCTFAGGIAASYTRPGQAALAFLRWIGGDFDADVLRGALASGNLALPESAEATGPAAVARALRHAGIGWGRRRHETALDARIAELRSPRPSRWDEEGTEDRAEHARRRDRRLAAALRAREFVSRALALAPDTSNPVGLEALARGAREFVAEFARVTGELDATASAALQKLFAELEALPVSRLLPATAVERLSDAVRALHITADRPRPGRIHVAEYRAGGWSGRPNTFLLGLDEARHPGTDREDPVLSDEERRRIHFAAAGRLALGSDRPAEATRALESCVARLRGSIAFGYSSWNVRNLEQPGEVLPAPFLLETFRARPGEADADFAALARALATAEGFVPDSDHALDDTEWGLARVAASPARGGAIALSARGLTPWLLNGRRAEEARESGEFGAWDGIAGTVAAGLDPRETGRAVSCSRLQTLAKCPYGYFLRHVLRIEAAEDVERDPTRWIDRKMEGTLLHRVFHAFFEERIAASQRPVFARDWPRIEAIAEAELARWRERIPPRSELAYENTRQDVLFACRTFLRIEEEQCRDRTPRFFEVPFGIERPSEGEEGTPASPIASPEPVEIDVGAGRTFRLRGCIDRVDQDADGSFHVWDYKTGNPVAVKEEAGIHAGRQIQPALYAMALEALLRRAGQSGSVSRSGYFFPGRKGQGQRFELPIEAEKTRGVLNALLDLLAAGAFPHSPDPEDCRFCEYAPICGGRERAAQRSRAKLATTADPILRAWGKLDA